MKENQKNQITEMRQAGKTYSDIAKALKLSQNTVKSYCLRHNVKVGDSISMPSYKIGDITKCEQCGAPVTQNSLVRRKRFCSDKCRMKWWNQHPNFVERRAVYEHTCKHCGKPFSAYGNARRKYCSHECYIKDRFGGGCDE